MRSVSLSGRCSIARSRGLYIKLLYHAVVCIVYCRNVELYGFNMSLPCVAIRDKWRYTEHISDY
ncbi:hypothetical protein ANAPH2_00825 [Anaplasma phagocytophilum]|nr:hypothetical protein ANAPH2_00825 [Anaplasma phagocytophilum]